MALNPPVRDWPQQCVWLVGASTGIGRATAAALHARGARVIVSARQAEVLQHFVAEHPGAEALPCDVTEPGALHAACQQVLARHGRIDLTVYCAGHYRPLLATGFDLEEALRHQQVNYVGALRWLDTVLPPLLRQAARGGPAHISLVASVAGYRGLPQALAYGPTKAALINLAETLYLDLSRHGIGVSLVNPGFVETPLTAQNRFHMPALLRPEQAAAALVSGWEAGRFEIHFPRRFTLALKALRALPDHLYFSAVQRWVHP